MEKTKEKTQVSTHETLVKRSITVMNGESRAEYSLPSWFPDTEAFYALPVLSQHGVAKAVIDFRAVCRNHMTGKITLGELNAWELKAFEVPKTKVTKMPETPQGVLDLLMKQFGKTKEEVLEMIAKADA